MYALEGIKVLDLTRVLAGPWCTQTLGDLGAEVWKIEEPTRGDDTRAWHPPQIHGQAAYYLCCNRNKMSVAVDFKSEEGRKSLRKLAASADILVENFRLGTLDRYGLGYEALKEINPGLIYCSISGYGRTGPRAAEAGYDFAIQAESGLMAITGEPDGMPMKLGVAIADVVTGMNATQAILAALIARGRTGRGQFIDISLLDSAVATLVNVGSAHLASNQEARRYGNAHATIVPYQVFETSDGALVVAVGNDLQFRNLCRDVVEAPELAADPRFATNSDRVVHRDALVEALSSRFLTGTTVQWLAKLRAAGVPVGKVRSVSEALSCPEIVERCMVQTVSDGEGRQYRLVASPLRLSGTPVREPSAPPRLGEHTAAVLGEE